MEVEPESARRQLSTMRRFLQPHTLGPVAAIVAVAVMVVAANIRDARRSRLPFTASPPIGTPGAPTTSREDLERRIAAMERRLETHSEDNGAALLLADALLRQTRVTGNVSLTGRAEQALTRVLHDDPASYDANRMLGTLYLSQHRFREAIRAGERNRDLRPHDSVNYGVIGDAQLELGNYGEAFAAFDRMMALRPGAASYARVAYARELQGDLKGAIESMTLATGATSPTDPEGLAWAHAQVGDLYMQLGRVREAKSEYAAASQAFPGHPFAMMGYSNVLAAEGDLPGALDLLRRLAETSPSPDLAARTGDLLRRLGREAEAERQFALAEAGWRGAREPKHLARFLADHDRQLTEAVMIAEGAAADRHDIFTDDALAWAYFKAGRVAEAKLAIARALRTGSRDASIRAHAAAIGGAVTARAAR
jgi:tetratricopeptide (TPR) repeat protein